MVNLRCLPICQRPPFRLQSGGIALSMGLSCGATVLAIVGLAIVITAPIGGLLIDITGKKWLSKTSLDTETVNKTNKNRHKYCLCSVSIL